MVGSSSTVQVHIFPHQWRERIPHSRLGQELWRKNKLKLDSISIPISHNPSQTLHEGLVSVAK